MAKTKFGKWLEKTFNIGHRVRNSLKGTDYEGQNLISLLSNPLENIIKKYTGTGMTDAEKESADLDLNNQRILNQEEFARKREWYEEFESPEAMVRQYKAAGINPALLYEGAPGVSASGGVGSAGSANVPSPGESDFLGSILSTILGFKQLGVSRSAVEAENAKRGAETESLTIENKYRDEHNRLLLEKERADVERTKQETANMRANVGLILANTDYARVMALYAPEYFESTIGAQRAQALRDQSQVSLNEKEVENLDAVIKVHKKELAEIDARIDQINSIISLNASQERMNDQSIQESKARVNKIEAEIKEIGKNIGLKAKDIEYYIWNHPRQSGGPLGIRWNTSSENGRTGKVAESMSENDMIFLLQNAGYTVEKRVQ